MAISRGSSPLLALYLLASSCAPTHLDYLHTDHALNDKLEELSEGFNGRVGIYVRHLDRDLVAGIAPDEIVGATDLVKLPILVSLYDRIENGDLRYRQSLHLSQSRIYSSRDLLASFKPGSRISLPLLVALATSTNDTSACRWLQELAGGGMRINRWLASRGFTKTRINAHTPGRKEDWEEHGWGQTTPREMATLLLLVQWGRAVGPAASDRLYRHLTRSFWDEGARALLPPWVQTASLQGAVGSSRSELMLVHGPSGSYVCCVITADQEDRSWETANEGYVLIRKLSEILWHHYEPDQAWTAPRPGTRWN